MRIPFLAYLSILFLQIAGFSQSDSSVQELLWPFEDFHTISSTFGEYRPGHLHMGLDLRTQRNIGIPVMAVDEGYISLIKVNPRGYGKSLFLTLMDGRTAVYAHLNSFTQCIEDYVRERQWETLSYNQTLFLPPEMFRFKKGDIIAYSGRSGTVQPHLHFEIRNPQDWALNPLTQGLKVKDDIPPQIIKLALIPVTNASEINSDCLPYVLKAQKLTENKYLIREIPQVFGEFAFEINCYDLSDGAYNRIAVYKLQLFFDSQLFFTCQYDSCSFTEYQQVELDHDPYLLQAGSGNFQRLFLADGNQLNFYQGTGIVDPLKFNSGLHTYSIFAEDYYGNRAELEGKVEIVNNSSLQNPILLSKFHLVENKELGKAGTALRFEIDFFPDYARIAIDSEIEVLHWANTAEYQIPLLRKGELNIGRMIFQPEMEGLNYLVTNSGEILDSMDMWYVTPEKGGRIISQDNAFQMIIPEGAVYEPLFVELQEKKVELGNNGYQFASDDYYHLQPEWVPFEKNAVIKWELPDTSSQVGIYGLNHSDRPVFLGHARRDHVLVASSGNLETFIALYDRNPPEIELIFPRKNGTIYARKPNFHFEIGDDLSGINMESIDVAVDGLWVLAEYDPPKKSVYAYLREPLASGKHLVSIYVSDRCGNVGYRLFNFTIGG